MAGIYPRTVSITRPNAAGGVGAQPYSSLQSAGETTLFTGLPASIQLSRRVGKPDPDLPSDPASAIGFTIYVPAAYLPNGGTTEKDTVIDELGKRYQITGAYWNLLGYSLTSTLLEE